MLYYDLETISFTMIRRILPLGFYNRSRFTGYYLRTNRAADINTLMIFGCSFCWRISFTKL